MIDPLDPDDDDLSDDELQYLDRFLLARLDAFEVDDDEPSDEELADDLGVDLPEDDD